MGKADPGLPTALSIAGSDPVGGAGIQADLKVFQRFGVYGTSALTLLTVQDTRGVARVEPVAPEWVRAQIEAVLGDIGARAIKTGALGCEAVVRVVAESLAAWREVPLVIDPVWKASAGAPLLREPGLAALREQLLPGAHLVTPNLVEAEALAGIAVRDETSMREAARILVGLGARAVLVTGGHLDGGEAVDILYDGRSFERLAAPRLPDLPTHGSGCTLSAAIAARLALGDDRLRAVQAAKEYVTRAIRTAPRVGRGRRPLNHWA